MIPVYNCSKYIAEAIKSVLVQSMPENEMQIEVIDDASTDADVEAIVTATGSGRVRYFRQKKNVGSLRNFETCINRSYGTFVHILHGDDKVKKGYYEKMGSLFQQYPDAGAAFCRYTYIDENSKKLFDQPAEMRKSGILKDWISRIGERNVIQFAAITVRRDVYEKLGSFYGLTYGEDWEMWVRIARNFKTAYTPDILAEYRKHTASITGQKFLTGEYLEDLCHSMQLIQKHLPARKKKKILQKSKKFYGHYGVRMASSFWDTFQNKLYVKASIKRSLELHRDMGMYWKIFKIYGKMFLHHFYK
jgi:glycosyltransferase involved in cell wall biosynthesis